jgi:hypothetical protein
LPPGRDGASSDPARHALSDPLAELARLIGQDEAFGGLVRSGAREEPRPEPQRQPEPSPPSWRGRAPAPGGERGHRSPAQPSYDYADTRRAIEPEPHDPHGYGEEADHALPPYDSRGDDTAPAGAPVHAEIDHAPADAGPGHYGHDTGGEYYGEGEGQDGHYEGEEDYADPAPQRRRGVLVMAAAVIGLALVGTAGAFGYWAWSTGPRSEPPLIKADTTPNKVVPATQGDSGGTKRIYDRFDPSGSSEKVVSREETPVEIKSAPPRQIYPSSGGVYGPAPAPPPAVVAPASPPPSGVSANGEPRRVHTETIRPNQVAAADIGQPVAPPLAAVQASPATPPAAPPPAPAPAKQVAPRAKQPAPVVVGSQSPAAQPTDAAPPAHEAAPTGGYVVQLSSQRTEEEARASYKALATKYASVFGDREPLIKRVTLPEKGTYFRASVGPFATASEANHFCSNLKIVGGQCIVQKN